MSRRPLLAVRADGGPGIGAGHLARCLALVQAWRDRGGDAVLVTADPPPAWADRYRAEGAAVVAPGDGPADADWWVHDGYRLGPAARPAGAPRLLLVDDHDTAGTGGAGADLVLDQNLGAQAARYPHVVPADVLAGPRFALLRRELVAAADAAGPSAGRRHLVVLLGGNPTPEVLAFADAVLADPRLAGVAVHRLAGSGDPGPAMAAAAVALAAAGSTAWELCRFAVPAVLVPVAANQVPLAERLAAAGAAVDAGPAGTAEPAAVAGVVADLLGDPVRRAAMAAAGAALVDGHGAARVATRLRAGLVDLRPAAPGDAREIHRWNDDPGTRAASFSSQPIPWPDHERWFAERIADPSSLLYVASSPGPGDLGLVRFTLSAGDPATAEIGVTVAPERRGAGWGGALVDAGCRRAAADRAVRLVRALIKEGNTASARAFRDADFDPDPGPVGEPGVLRYLRVMEVPGG